MNVSNVILMLMFMIATTLGLHLLASERSERDTLRSVQLRIGDIYIMYI